MIVDQNHLSDISSEQKVIKHIKKIAQLLGLNKQNSKVYNVLSKEIGLLTKKLNNYHSKYNSSKFLETKYLDKYVDRQTVINLIQEIALSSNIKKYKSFSYSSEIFEDSDE